MVVLGVWKALDCCVCWLVMYIACGVPDVQ